MSAAKEKLLMLSEQLVVNSSRAKAYSEEIASQCGIETGSIGYEDKISLSNGRTTSPKAEIPVIRKTGAGDAIQEIYDPNNRLFQMNILDLGFSIFGTAGLEIKVSSSSPVATVGRSSKSMAHFHPLRQLSQDILKIREICIQNSASAKHCLPFYSAYLTLCVTIVDCFINYCSKHISISVETHGMSVTDYVGELLSN